jgi:hypothetical protein
VKTKIVISLVVEVGDDDEIASIVNDQLDEGVIQDVIAEWLADRYGGEIEFIDSRCRTEDLSPTDAERIAADDCNRAE